jgi:alpha-amylase
MHFQKAALQLSAILAALIPCTIFARDFQPPAPEDLIIYQVFVDRFENGDSTNDDGNPRASFQPNAPQGFHGGDLEGIRKQLPYIHGLGANAIWMTPIVENVSDYHGYGAYNWYNVDPNFGDMEKLRELIDEAHDLGIAIFFDMVAGHCGNIIDSRSSGYPGYLPPPGEYTLRWSTNLTYPPPFDSLDYFHAHGHIGGFNAPEQELGELSGLDDLKTETPYVREKMTDIWKYWIRESGLDGFRIDTVKHVDKGMWEYMLPRLREEAAAQGLGNLFTFGEIYGADDAYMSEYVGTLDGGVYKLDSALDFQFYYNSQSVFARADRPPSDIAGRLAYRQSVLGAHHLMTPNFIDNHDVPRFLNVAAQNPGSGLAERHRRLEMALVFLLTSPGPPVIYYGTEQAFDGGNDPYNREDMFDGAFEFGPSLGNNFDSASAFFRLIARLSDLRHQLAPLRRGDFQVHRASSDGPGPLAFSRSHNGESVVVIMNTATAERSIASFAVPALANATLTNALRPTEELVLDAQGTFPARTLGAQSSEVWAPANLVPPPEPGVVAFVPADGDNAVPADVAQVRVEFLTPMDIESTNAAITLDPAIPFSVSWNAEQTEVTLQLAEQLEPRTPHTVNVAATAKSAEGRELGVARSATWTTGRLPLPLPPLAPPVVLPETNVAITIDGNAADWPAASLADDTGAVLPQHVYRWLDAEHDDDGPGGYAYPTDNVFSGGDADIVDFALAYDTTNVYVMIRPRVINPAASFFTPHFGIAIDSIPGSGIVDLGYDQATGARGIAEAQIRSDTAQDFEVSFTGPRGAMLTNTQGDTIPIASAFSQQTGVVELAIPRAAVALQGDQLLVNMVVYSALETFGGMREVGLEAGRWEPGGGIIVISDPDIFDLAGGSAEDQVTDLSSYDETFPTIIRHSLLRFRLGNATADGWVIY